MDFTIDHFQEYQETLQAELRTLSTDSTHSIDFKLGEIRTRLIPLYDFEFDDEIERLLVRKDFSDAAQWMRDLGESNVHLSDSVNRMCVSYGYGSVCGMLNAKINTSTETACDIDSAVEVLHGGNELLFRIRGKCGYITTRAMIIFSFTKPQLH